MRSRISAASRSRGPDGGSMNLIRSGVDGIHLRPSRPLLAGSARSWAGALLACCAILVAALGVLFADQVRADRLDHAGDAPILTWVGAHPGLVGWPAPPGSLLLP